ncbi:MAG: branched-chain amino acid ABC transporter permease [Oscillospiraceae bacterium]|jgi:branched-chain amino acid transport system permease protein|nr:branched-chain amino acid ABC transporter permease [Oscillospiraceae bacterium]
MNGLNNKSPSLLKEGGALALSVYKNTYLRFIAFGAVLALLPVLQSAGLMKASTLSYLGNVLIYAVVALGLNLLLGYSGLISLGTAGFMGFGSYLAAIFTENLQLSFWVALLVAVAVPTLFGVAIGFVSLRIEGIYLAIATLCVSEILLKTFEQVEEITGGMQGKKANYPVIFGSKLDRSGTYLLLVIALILTMMLTYNLVNGQMGRAMHAMRGSEVAAQAMGVNLLKYRLISFALATAYAGFAGALYVFFIKYTYPTVWNINLSLYVLAAVVIGGMRSIYGTVVGAFLVWAVPDLVLKNLPVIGKINGLPYIFNGVLIILVIMFFPEGLAGIPTRIKLFIKRIKEKNAAKGGAQSA